MDNAAMSADDIELLSRWSKERDADAFHEIVSRHAGMVYGACLRILRNPQEAEDVSQDCFLTLATTPASVRSSVGGWLHQLATHRALDRLRSSKRRNAREEKFATPGGTLVEPDWDETKSYVDEAIAALPEKNRSIVVSHFLEGETYEAIAAAQGAPISTIASRARRGVELIRENLSKRGIVVPATTLATFLAEQTVSAAPATLTASLGKLAVAGAGSAAVPTVFSVTNASALLGGTLLMKKAIIGVVVVLAGLVLIQMNSPKDEEPVVEIAREEATPPLDVPEPVVIEAPVAEPESDPEPEETPVAAAQIDPDLGSISGTVVDSIGTPLTGWTAYAQSAEGGRHSEPDESNAFTIPSLQPGEYEVYARKPPSFARALALSKVALRPGEKIRGLTLVFDLGQSLSGTVLSSDGEPVPNAQVRSWLTEQPANSGSGLAIFDAQSDASGHYVITGVPDSQGIHVNLQVLHPHYLTAHRYSVVVDGNEQDFTLFETPTIEGRILDAVSRAPIMEYRLHSWMGDGFNEDDYLASAGRRKLETHPDGRFSFRVSGFNQVRIAISAPGYATGLHRLENVQPGKTVTEVEILLQPIAPLTGTVIHSDGSPVRDARIFLGYPQFVVGSFSSSVRGITQTDSNGAFLITEYPESLSVISAHHADYAPAWINVAKPFFPVEIVLTNGGGLEGFITYGGVALENKRSHVNIVTDDSIVMQTYSGDGGHYALEKVPTGLVTVVVGFHEGGLRRYINRDIDLRTGETRRQDFDFGDAYDSYVEGTLLLNDRPVELSLLRAIVHFENGDRVDYQTETAGDGSYRLGPIPAAVFEFGALWILLDDGSYLEPPYETISTRAGETTHHDIILVTE